MRRKEESKILMPCSRARRTKRKKKKVKRLIKKRKKKKRKTHPDMQGSKDVSNIHPMTITITQTTTSLPLRLDPIAFTVRCDDLET